jgi:hypothetical protein
MYHFLRNASPQAGRLKIVKNIALSIAKLQAINGLNQLKNHYGSRTTSPEKIFAIHAYGTSEIASCDTWEDIRHTQEIIGDVICSYADPPPRYPLKVALIGEFYIMIESLINIEIENLLLHQGVNVSKFVHSGSCSYSKPFLQGLGLYSPEREFRSQFGPSCQKYIRNGGMNLVGSPHLNPNCGYDGIIHIFPRNCIPEIIAHDTLINICNFYRMPLLSLGLDEHSSGVSISAQLKSFSDHLKEIKADQSED